MNSSHSETKLFKWSSLIQKLLLNLSVYCVVIFICSVVLQVSLLWSQVMLMGSVLLAMIVMLDIGSIMVSKFFKKKKS